MKAYSRRGYSWVNYIIEPVPGVNLTITTSKEWSVDNHWFPARIQIETDFNISVLVTQEQAEQVIDAIRMAQAKAAEWDADPATIPPFVPEVRR